MDRGVNACSKKGTHMRPCKSLDESEIIAALLHDVQNAHGLVFNTRALRLTCQKVKSRTRMEGLGFLTKTLPRLGKALDRALTGQIKLNSTVHGFDTMSGSELPRFLGEFFSLVFRPDGAVLPHPCATSVRVLRQVLYLFYKYELPYTHEQEQQVVAKFERTEHDLTTSDARLREIGVLVSESCTGYMCAGKAPYTLVQVAQRAQRLLKEVFARFDPKDIYPKHGPGSVATKQRLWDKYLWKNISAKITSVYPMDEYFYTSLGHVCDVWQSFKGLTQEDLPARVVLVPKDSRGPRLISCEPVDFQWIQQGLGKAIVKLVESHWLTKANVRFTDQSPNRIGALSGSSNGRYATLDLNEASDRVSTDLVRLLFPSDVFTYLESCRSSCTVLPDGRVLNLRKFAPMGSCLCFPILALTVWAILAAAAPDAYTRDRIYVYGDDVIVPTAYAANAIEHLESFGLKINHDKSCTSGFFRESCGMDAFMGTDVTPVRIRTVWSSAPRADVYTSWIAYANSFYDKRYFRTYDYIVSRLVSVYERIPDKDMQLACPSLREAPDGAKKIRRRYNKSLQKLEYKVWDVSSPKIKKTIDGWSMLLRYFAEVANGRNVQSSLELEPAPPNPIEDSCDAFSVDTYTKRRASLLAYRWR